MELWELVARESIRDTVARYNRAGDTGRYEEMVACFAPDGVLAVSGESEHHGRTALLAFFSGVAASARPGFTHLRHCVTNLTIDVDGPTAASATSYFLVVTDIGLDHWGRYRDRLVPDPDSDRWLLAERAVKTDGYAAGSFFAHE
ncbi:MAG: nuclear transport factor 2 family protein [Acidimicrobiia bacterium]